MASIVRSPSPFAPPKHLIKVFSNGWRRSECPSHLPPGRAKTRLSPSARNVPGIRSCSFFFRGGLFSLNRARTFSPTRPCARRDVRFTRVSTALQMTLQARSFFLRGRADWSPTARLDEHRLPRNTMDLVCAFREHKRLTGRPASLLHRGCKDSWFPSR